MVDALQDGDEVTFDLEKSTVSTGRGTLSLPPLPDFAREIIDAGGITPYVREHGRFPGEG